MDASYGAPYYLEQPDPHTKVWRYMDFPKFVDVLLNQALFFTQLKRFLDPSEGWSDDYLPPGSPGWDVITPLYNSPKSHRAFFVASCWCISDHEDDIMWGRYGGNPNSVALVTSVEKLLNGLRFDQRHNVVAGKVMYGQDRWELVAARPTVNEAVDSMLDAFCKDIRFSKDREYRIVVDAVIDLTLVNELGGLYVTADLPKLLEQIYIAPNAERWFVGLVKRVLLNTNLSRIDVVHSDLLKKPHGV